MKKLLIVSAFILAFGLTACGSTQEIPTTTSSVVESTSSVVESIIEEESTPSTEASTESSEEEVRVFTMEELAQYNGKDGNPAYVAVDGIVYDVTDLPKWNNGDHNGYEAGQDLTEIIKEKSPHGIGKLEGVPTVGVLAE